MVPVDWDNVNDDNNKQHMYTVVSLILKNGLVMADTTTLLLHLFYSPLDCVREYQGKPVPET